ncbi:hypothetical protein K1T71_005835 [Dendrolimus kikuchii]|uniref:Uncharacterized protein n=1 Tax=Dendrolimus kikuchii TaxID=765133 RepID=A0ACC1D5I1_9NEOP|nr:hypothetical protein K1T71_005835 [Dendrolimus kikuchii]
MRREEYLPAPLIKSLSAIDPAGFQVEWTRVDSYDDMDPVLGYKVKIWEVCDKRLLYDKADGAVMLAKRDTRFSQALESRRIPDSEPFVIILPGFERTRTKVSNIKLNVLYEVRVLAYTRTMDGPLSQPTRIKLMKDNESDRHKEVYIAS